jgi:hypothetical protein
MLLRKYKLGKLNSIFKQKQPEISKNGLELWEKQLLWEIKTYDLVKSNYF